MFTLSANSRLRGSDEPSGRRVNKITYPWSSVGRNPVGLLRNCQKETMMIMMNTINIKTGRFTMLTTSTM